MVNLIYLVLFAVVFYSDWKRYIIPDTVLLVILVFTLGLMAPYPMLFPILNRLMSAFMCVMLAYIVFCIVAEGSIGLGDVKLLGVIGFVVGSPLVLLVVFIALFTAGISAIYFMRAKKPGVPLGAFLSIGVVVALVWGEKLITWGLTYFTHGE